MLKNVQALCLSLLFIGVQVQAHADLSQREKEALAQTQAINERLDFLYWQKKVWRGKNAREQGKALFNPPAKRPNPTIPAQLEAAVCQDMMGMTFGKGDSRYNLNYKERAEFVEAQERFWHAMAQNNKQEMRRAAFALQKIAQSSKRVPDTIKVFVLGDVADMMDMKVVMRNQKLFEKINQPKGIPSRQNDCLEPDLSQAAG